MTDELGSFIYGVRNLGKQGNGRKRDRLSCEFRAGFSFPVTLQVGAGLFDYGQGAFVFSPAVQESKIKTCSKNWR